MGVYTADLDLIAARIDQMTAFERSLEQHLTRLQADLDRLHDTWTGQAADAQQRAHDQWSKGAEEMRTALADLRSVAEVARSNYANAAEANLTMWNRIS
ncbi:MAG: esxE [Nocardioides sp.]|nr:esxE [Nocardioides sp.]